MKQCASQGDDFGTIQVNSAVSFHSLLTLGNHLKSNNSLADVI